MWCLSIHKRGTSSNIKYLLGCTKCPQQYIVEKERTLEERFSKHKCYVNTNKRSKATGVHFNAKGHSVSDMEITVIEKIFCLGNREKNYIFRNSTRDIRVSIEWTVAEELLIATFSKKCRKFSIWYSSNLFFDNVELFWTSLMWNL